MSGYANVMHTWYFASAAVGIGALMLVQLVGAHVEHSRPEAAAKPAPQHAPPPRQIKLLRAGLGLAFGLGLPLSANWQVCSCWPAVYTGRSSSHIGGRAGLCHASCIRPTTRRGPCRRRAPPRGERRRRRRRRRGRGRGGVRPGCKISPRSQPRRCRGIGPCPRRVRRGARAWSSSRERRAGRGARGRAGRRGGGQL